MKNITPPKPNNPIIEKDVFEAFMQLERILRKECPCDSKQNNKIIAHLTM